jgi:hypothetical protein
VTVTVPASAKVTRQVTGSVSDIADGAQVIVRGTGSAGTIAAQSIVRTAIPDGQGQARVRRGHHHHRG